jgi:hypothetical protein
MDYEQTMRRLESMGTAQSRKVYGRHGVGRAMFGVSYADLGRLEKTIIGPREREPRQAVHDTAWSRGERSDAGQDG